MSDKLIREWSVRWASDQCLIRHFRIGALISLAKWKFRLFFDTEYSMKMHLYLDLPILIKRNRTLPKITEVNLTFSNLHSKIGAPILRESFGFECENGAGVVSIMVIFQEGSHHLRDIFLRDISSARHFNCAISHLRDNPVARHFNSAISHPRDFLVARHPICATFQLRDIPSARQPICATFFFSFWKPRWTSLIWPNLTKPNLIYALSSLAKRGVIRPDLNQTK